MTKLCNTLRLMRGTSKELPPRAAQRHSPVALLQTLRDSATVSPRRTRTADYDEADRIRLAEAVVAARTAAGWNSTMDLVRAVGRSQRAIYALEAAEPTVGQSILQAVGATLGTRLRGWDANTPRRILDGHQAPPIQPSPAPERADDEDIWSDEAMYVFAALDEIAMRKTGKPIEDNLASMRAFQDRKRSPRRPAESAATQHHQSHEDSD